MAVASKNSIVMVEVSGSLVALTEVRDWSLEMERGTIDASVLSTEWKRFLVGQISATGSMNLFFDPTDSAVETAMDAALFNGAAITLLFRPQGSGSGKPQYKVPAIITSKGVSAATEDAVGISIGFSANAAVDNAAQSA